MPTVLITGGSRGIGAQMVRTFFHNGWNVVLNYCSHREEAEALCRELSGVLAIQADIGDPEQVEQMFCRIHEVYPTIDVLINNAGISRTGLFEDFSVQEWQEIFSVNFFGAVYCIQQALKDMRRRGKGKIINMSSIWGLKGASCESSYASSKAALIGLTRSLAKELGRGGICVNCIAPGVIQTEMNALHSVETMRELAEEVPVGRIGLPEDVAALALFLASPAADYINGQVLGVDGGFLLT